MKKTMIGLVLSALMGLGLVSVSTGTADAITCPYSGCVATKSSLDNPRTVKSGSRITFRVAVTPKSGVGYPQGKVTLRCSGPGHVHKKVRSYNGEPRAITMHFTAKGTWGCTLNFASAKKWRASGAASSFRVV